MEEPTNESGQKTRIVFKRNQAPNDGNKKPENNNPLDRNKKPVGPKFSFYWIYGILAVVFLFFSYFSNNSAKTITAYQVHIHADTGIEGSKPMVEYFKDFAPHPDIREYEQLQPILPGAYITYGPRGVKLENEPNKKIQTLMLKLDFVVYEDGTFVSSVKDGADAVLGARRGAEIFKQLAMKVYNENNKSADKLLEWLVKIKPYQDMFFEGEKDAQSYQILGANGYRMFLQRLCHGDRIALNKYLTEVK